MITDCEHKITEWVKAFDPRNTKCKLYGRYVKKCVGESECEYVEKMNKDINKAMGKK